MNSPLPFIGFQELIETPLAQTDQRSFSLINGFFTGEHQYSTQPFSTLIEKLTGQQLPNSEAIICWQQILKHKILLQHKLGRTVGIQTASIDYFEYQSPPDLNLRLSSTKNETASAAPGAVIEALYLQGYHCEKLKEELLRAKRYKHALSVIMLDIDNFPASSSSLSVKDGDKVLATIVKIIKKIIRNVDFFCRLSEDRFFLILPNTNQREAKELAERIRIQISERTKKLGTLSAGITVTLSVGQCSPTDSSIEFVRRIERILDEGKRKNGNSVYQIS